VRKLELRKLRDALGAVVDETFGLDNRKAQLALSMEERSREVRATLSRAQRRRARAAAARAPRQGARRFRIYARGAGVLARELGVERAGMHAFASLCPLC
jgi:hypothetical protein